MAYKRGIAMTHLLIKVSPERDLYVLWTSVADGPLRLASRAEYENRLPIHKLITDPFNPGHLVVDEPQVFAVADEFGSANTYGGRGYFDWVSEESLFFTWDEEGGYSGDLIRENFEAFVDAYLTFGGRDGELLKPYLNNLDYAEES
jgi:hypothetical protein